MRQDVVQFWKNLPKKLFADEFVSLAKTLQDPKKLISQMVETQETRDLIESKIGQFTSEETDKYFKDALLDYLDFYDQKVRPELIHFAEEFRSAIQTLSDFLALQTSDELPETICNLLKFSVKHSEFVERLLDAKSLKARKLAALKKSKSPQTSK